MKSSSINRYHINEIQEYGTVVEHKKCYNLLEVIILRLGYNQGITLNHDVERKVEEMCNLSVGVCNLGMEKGVGIDMKRIVHNMVANELSDDMILKLVKITKEQLELWKKEMNTRN